MGELLNWWNFVFALPLAVGLLLSLGVVLMGAHSDHAHDGDADHGHGDHPDPGDHGHGSPLGDLAGFFGFGRGISLSLLLPMLMATWGLVGLVSNNWLSSFLPPALFFPVSALLGLLGAALVGQGLARLMGRLFASRKSAIQTGDLVGMWGRAAFRVTATGGAANVRDRFGNIHRVVCQTLPGEPELEAGREILVLDYDKERGVYLVQAHPFPQEARPN